MHRPKALEEYDAEQGGARAKLSTELCNERERRDSSTVLPPPLIPIPLRKQPQHHHSLSTTHSTAPSNLVPPRPATSHHPPRSPPITPDRPIARRGPSTDLILRRSSSSLQLLQHSFGGAESVPSSRSASPVRTLHRAGSGGNESPIRAFYAARGMSGSTTTLGFR